MHRSLISTLVALGVEFALMVAGITWLARAHADTGWAYCFTGIVVLLWIGLGAMHFYHYRKERGEL